MGAGLTGRPDSFDLFVVRLLQSNHALLKFKLLLTECRVKLIDAQRALARL